jgi:hypothetical protein
MSAPNAPVLPEDYEEACRRLETLLASAEARTLLECLERIVRYESEHGIDRSEGFASRLGTKAPAARRTAIISDIHGNLEGLRAVLADIARQACDRILCLGDLVDGGPANDEVVATLRDMGVRTVRGNHDEHNDVVLAEQTRAWLPPCPR